LLTGSPDPVGLSTVTSKYPNLAAVLSILKVFTLAVPLLTIKYPFVALELEPKSLSQLSCKILLASLL